MKLSKIIVMVFRIKQVRQNTLCYTYLETNKN